MPNITDDGELDYSDEEHYDKPKNDLKALELQAKIAQSNAQTSKQKSRTQIIVAIIGLIGVIFAAIVPVVSLPSSSSDERQSIVGALFFLVFDERDRVIEPTPTADPPEVAVEATQTAIASTPNIVETSVAETLTAIATSATIGPGPSPSYTSTSSATATNVPTNTAILPSPTPPPVLINTIEVLGSSNTGAEFTAPQTGRYFFRFDSGGYCTHGTNPGFPTCLPTVWLFQSGVDLWEDDGRTLNQNNASRIIAPVSDCGAGRGAYCNTIEEAEAQGRNSGEVRMNLEAGSTWILIGVDHREAYLDNPGTVFIDVFHQPE